MARITVKPSLVLVDKDKQSAVDNVPSLFVLGLSESGRLQAGRTSGEAGSTRY